MVAWYLAWVRRVGAPRTVGKAGAPSSGGDWKGRWIPLATSPRSCCRTRRSRYHQHTRKPAQCFSLHLAHPTSIPTARLFRQSPFRGGSRGRPFKNTKTACSPGGWRPKDSKGGGRADAHILAADLLAEKIAECCEQVWYLKVDLADACGTSPKSGISYLRELARSVHWQWLTSFEATASCRIGWVSQWARSQCTRVANRACPTVHSYGSSCWMRSWPQLSTCGNGRRNLITALEARDEEHRPGTYADAGPRVANFSMPTTSSWRRQAPRISRRCMATWRGFALPRDFGLNRGSSSCGSRFPGNPVRVGGHSLKVETSIHHRGPQPRSPHAASARRDSSRDDLGLRRLLPKTMCRRCSPEGTGPHDQLNLQLFRQAGELRVDWHIRTSRCARVRLAIAWGDQPIEVIVACAVSGSNVQARLRGQQGGHKPLVGRALGSRVETTGWQTACAVGGPLCQLVGSS